ncbi:GFA family protein [Pseudoxanthomonas dokdonensis]|uniref:Aldehyde-activating protein n=1 Tax=Pseudoxanthomonas dokdonensis TaxID=344882 RepID=A0A0R0CYL5_9GAMM|nr:GFA family protein [Pseudoxanthomonas dokdonensis]KRG71246.1 aldehyde-activating protein [Pseudoxanthomonas dokdonensis]
MATGPQQDAHQGGCLCGQLRYRISAALEDIAHCHCRMCRKASGGIVTTWVTVPLAAVQWIHGTPRTFASSTHTTRYFCAGCGAQLALYTQRAADTIDITVATLDDAARHPANRHIWYDSRLPWLHLDEELPHEEQELY